MSRLQKITLIIVLLFGIFLRLHEYFENHTFWFDEANIAFKLTSIPLSEFVQDEDGIMDNLQPVPVGMIYILKSAIRLFGNHEYSLRLFPLLSGILSLFLFFCISLKLFSVAWSIFALFIFSVSRDLIYFSSELKPYASDVCISLLLILMFMSFMDAKSKSKKVMVGGFIGAVLIWFSFPSTLMLFGISAGMISWHALKKNPNAISTYIFMSGFWMASFLAYYFFSLQYYLNDQALSDYWIYYFAPLKKGLAVSLQWIITAFKRIFSSNLQMPSSLAAFLFICGIVFLFKENKEKCIILTAPILLTLTLALGQVYPFGGRVLSFLMPSFMLLMVYGISRLCASEKNRFASALVILTVLFLMFYPLIFCARQFIEPYGIGELKPVLQYVKKNKQNGDAVALYYGALPSYRYYYEKYGLAHTPVVPIAKRHIIKMIEGAEGIDQLFHYKRVWLIFSDVGYHKGINKRRAVLQWFEGNGKRADAYEVKVIPNAHIRPLENNMSAAVYLYHLVGKKT